MEGTQEVHNLKAKISQDLRRQQNFWKPTTRMGDV